MQFSFDNQQQSIMGVVITDRQCYRCVRDAMLFNVYEGWRPTVTDVQRAVRRLRRRIVPVTASLGRHFND